MCAKVVLRDKAIRHAPTSAILCITTHPRERNHRYRNVAGESYRVVLLKHERPCHRHAVLFKHHTMCSGPVSACKVSPLEAVSDELNVPPAEIAVKIQELETRGAFKGIMIDDARGRGSFVRLGDNEMLALAAVVAERGRLAVADFAAEANRVLQLSGGGEEAEQTARPHSEHQHALGYEAGRQAPCDGCTEGQERNEESAKPSSDGGTAAVVGSSIGAESSSV